VILFLFQLARCACVPKRK